jgi:hypothetical protein
MSALRLGKITLLTIAGIFALAILAAPVQIGTVNTGLMLKSAHADNNNGNNSNNPPTTATGGKGGGGSADGSGNGHPGRSGPGNS